MSGGSGAIPRRPGHSRQAASASPHHPVSTWHTLHLSEVDLAGCLSSVAGQQVRPVYDRSPAVSSPFTAETYGVKWKCGQFPDFAHFQISKCPGPTSTTTRPPRRRPAVDRGGGARARATTSATPRACTTSGSVPRRCSTRRARRSAQLIGAEPAEIVFTSGGTESDNLALRGAAEALEPSGRATSSPRSIEHEAVLNTVKALVKRGWTSTLLPGRRDRHRRAGVARRGHLARDGDRLGDAREQRDRHDPADRRSRGDRARARRALPHRRGAVGRRRSPVDVKALGVDLLTLSAHKFNGPKGAGALWIRRGTRLVSTMTGGKHERNRRGGTENVPGIAGMGVAARLAQRASCRPRAARVAALRDRLETRHPRARARDDRQRRARRRGCRTRRTSASTASRRSRC